MNEAYREQVRLMLDLLPFIADESIFALEGGTAINFFVRDMPRRPRTRGRHSPVSSLE